MRVLIYVSLINGITHNKWIYIVILSINIQLVNVNN